MRDTYLPCSLVWLWQDIFPLRTRESRWVDNSYKATEKRDGEQCERELETKTTRTLSFSFELSRRFPFSGEKEKLSSWLCVSYTDETETHGCYGSDTLVQLISERRKRDESLYCTESSRWDSGLSATQECLDRSIHLLPLRFLISLSFGRNSQFSVEKKERSKSFFDRKLGFAGCLQSWWFLPAVLTE
jgi:hypothetical protein